MVATANFFKKSAKTLQLIPTLICFTLFKNLYNFDTRATRREYWIFTLFFWLMLAILYGLTVHFITNPVCQVVLLICFLVMFGLAKLGVSLRRLQDSGLSGAWYFLVVIPYLGWLVIAVLMCRAPTVGKNRYGFDPRLEYPYVYKIW